MDTQCLTLMEELCTYCGNIMMGECLDVCCYMLMDTKTLQCHHLSIMTHAIIIRQILCPTGYHQRKNWISAPLAFLKGIHQLPVDSPHYEPVLWKAFTFYDVFKVCKPLLKRWNFHGNISCFSPKHDSQISVHETLETSFCISWSLAWLEHESYLA